MHSRLDLAEGSSLLNPDRDHLSDYLKKNLKTSYSECYPGSLLEM